jgi:hypothetical protein
MTNWNIDFIEDEDFPDFEPSTIWINFWGKSQLFKEDYERILRIFGNYNESEIVMMNLARQDRKMLTFLFQDFSRVKVLKR